MRLATLSRDDAVSARLWCTLAHFFPRSRIVVVRLNLCCRHFLREGNEPKKNLKIWFIVFVNHCVLQAAQLRASNQDGVYMLRDKTGIPDAFVLSFIHTGTVIHHLIEKCSDGSYTADKKQGDWGTTKKQVSVFVFCFCFCFRFVFCLYQPLVPSTST